MDKTDIIIAMSLLQDSRIPYQKLADQFDLSVNAVHKRIQSLVAQGIIRKFTAKIGLSSLGAIGTLIYGSSESPALSRLHKKLGEQGSVYWIGYSGRNYLYVGAYLKNLSELDSIVEFVRTEAEMPRPTVGLMPPAQIPTQEAKDLALYPLDYRIIHALRDDARKPVSEVAEELGISAKTARRRLAQMIRHQLVDLSMEWYPDVSDDIISLFHVRPKPSTQKRAIDEIVRKFFPNLLFYYSFSNLPNELLFFSWTNSMKQLRGLVEQLEGVQVFETAMPNILYTGYMFDTWRDKLLINKARA